MFSSKYRLLVVIFVAGVFLSPVYALATFDELRLMDVQPNIGGHRFIIRANGEYEIQIIKPSRSGQKNREYTGQLDLADFKRIKRALKASRFVTMKLPASYGDSSASGPVIQLITDGKTISKQKMTGARHRRFDELYGTLLAVINKIGHKKRHSDDLDIPVLP